MEKFPPQTLKADTVVGDLPFNVVLRDRALLPLPDFFSVTAEDPRARNPLADSLWPKQAYAFVHMCQFRADGKLKQPFERFIARLAREPLSERLFRECFGLSYRQMLEELRQYIRHPRHVFRDLKLAKGNELSAVDVGFREATQAEIARIKGHAQRDGRSA